MSACGSTWSSRLLAWHCYSARTAQPPNTFFRLAFSDSQVRAPRFSQGAALRASCMDSCAGRSVPVCTSVRGVLCARAFVTATRQHRVGGRSRGVSGAVHSMPRDVSPLSCCAPPCRPRPRPRPILNPGGITNWLAITMLFKKIPGVYGSGVIPVQYAGCPPSSCGSAGPSGFACFLAATHPVV